MNSQAKQATPHSQLIAELLDSRVPKTEREHAAVREIERLRIERDEHARWRAKLADDLHDARRYRWLRNEANTARKCDPMVCIYPLDEQDLIDGDRLDVAIDAAMDLTRPAEET